MVWPGISTVASEGAVRTRATSTTSKATARGYPQLSAASACACGLSLREFICDARPAETDT